MREEISRKTAPLRQMILAAILCAAVVVPGMIAVHVASAKEQAAMRDAERERRAAVLVLVEAEPEAVTAQMRENGRNGHSRGAAAENTAGRDWELPQETETAMPLYDVPLDADLQYYIIDQSMAQGIDPAIILAMIDRESDFDPTNMGDNGQAYGLMQIHPRHHRERMERLGCDNLLDPYQNVTVGLDFLAELINKYSGDVEMALMAYNAGTTGANKYWFSKGIYTNDYSREVMENAEKYAKTCPDWR